MTIQIIGRSSSHFTRVARMFAHELGVPFALEVVHDFTSLDSAAFCGNPALKIPSLREGDDLLFGTENICRRLAELAGRANDPRVIFPDRSHDAVVRNAQELTWHAMATQVQLVVATLFGKIPVDNPFVAKAQASLRGALAWLDAHARTAIARLPPHDVSLLETCLLCLFEHLEFRPTVPLDGLTALRAIAAELAQRPAAAATVFRFDATPAPPAAS